MARARGPLMSEQASGTFQSAIVFHRDGRVMHAHRSPRTRTGAQGTHRQIVSALQAVVRVFRTEAIQAVRAVAPDPRSWSGYLTTLATQNGRAAWNSAAAAWSVLLEAQRDEWDDAAAVASIAPRALTYASEAAVSGGEALFAVAYVMYSNGILTAPGVPQGDNALDWLTALTTAEAGPPANALTLAGDVLTLAGDILTIGA